MAKPKIKNDNIELIEKGISRFESHLSGMTLKMSNKAIRSYATVLIDAVVSCQKRIIEQYTQGKKDNTIVKKNKKIIDEAFVEYEKAVNKAYNTLYSEAFVGGKPNEPKINGLEFSMRISEQITKRLQQFVHFEGVFSNLRSLVDKEGKKKKGLKIGAGTALSVLTGSAVPMMIPDAIKAAKQWKLEYSESTAKGKAYRLASLASLGAGTLFGTGGGLLGASYFKQKANEDLELNKSTDKDLNEFLKKIRKRTYHVGGMVGGKGESLAKLMGGERVLSKEQNKTFIEMAKTNKSIDDSLKKLVRSSEKSAFLAEETLEDARDREAREGLLSKKGGLLPSFKFEKKADKEKELVAAGEGGALSVTKGMLLSKLVEKIATPKNIGRSLGGAVGAGAGGYLGYKAGGWLSDKAVESGLVEEGGVGANAIKYGTTALGTLGGALAGSKVGGKLGSKLGGMFGRADSTKGMPVYITNIKDMPVGEGGVADAAGDLLKGGKKGGKVGKLGKMFGKLGKGAGLLKGAARFAGPLGLAITAASAIQGAYEGATNADAIAGTKPGEATALQRTGAGLAGAASSLTFGLIKPELMYQGISAMATFSPAGLLYKGFTTFFKDQKESNEDQETILEKTQSTIGGVFTSFNDKLSAAYRSIVSGSGGGSYPDVPSQGGTAREIDRGNYVEKREGGTRSWRNNNPGNLRFAGQKGAVGKDAEGFAIFESLEAGEAARKSMLFGGKSSHYTSDMTISDMVAKYAPSSENNTAAYQRKIISAVGANKRLGELTPEEQNKVLVAMKQHEGFKEGTVSQYSKVPPMPTSSGLAMANIADQTMAAHAPVASSRNRSEGNVNTIVNSSHGLALTSEANRLKTVEAATDAAMVAGITKGTSDAINKINISSPSPSVASSPTIVLTGDTESFVMRIANSYS